MTSSDDPGGPAAPFRMTPAVFHVLFSLADGPAHAYGVMRDVEQRTGGAVTIGPGSLHFTLSRLHDAAMIEETGAPPEPDREDSRRKYWTLTAFGRAVLRAEARRLADLVDLAREKKLIPEPGRG